MSCKEKYDDIAYELSKFIYNPFRKLKQGIINLVRYFPVIWSDRNWDYHFIYKLLHRKLELMEDEFRSDKVYAANAINTADEIKEAKDILHRLIQDRYLLDALKPYDDKYGEDAELFTFEKMKSGKASKLVWTDNEEQLKMFGECSKLSYELKEKDITNLFSNLKNNIQKWWD